MISKDQTLVFLAITYTLDHNGTKQQGVEEGEGGMCLIALNYLADV